MSWSPSHDINEIWCYPKSRLILTNAWTHKALRRTVLSSRKKPIHIPPLQHACICIFKIYLLNVADSLAWLRLRSVGRFAKNFSSYVSSCTWTKGFKGDGGVILAVSDNIRKATSHLHSPCAHCRGLALSYRFQEVAQPDFWLLSWTPLPESCSLALPCCFLLAMLDPFCALRQRQAYSSFSLVLMYWFEQRPRAT